MPLRSLYLDLNSYFASVEQQDDPALRGRPVAVVPMHADNTAVLAASYEAKRHGIRTGTRVRDAVRMCPDLKMVLSRTERYVEVHHAMIAAVDTVLPVEKVWSIDELCCALRGPDQEPETALDLARRIKIALRSRVGECITASIGIAPNRWLAKIASDMHKPDGLTMIRDEDLPSRLHHLSLRDLPGVGPRMEKRLLAARIGTVEELCSRTETQLREAWGGVTGSFYYHALRGSPIQDQPHPKRSVGHEHVLGPARRTQDGAREVLVRLVSKAAARCRGYGLVAGEFTLSVRLLDPEPRRGAYTASSLRWGMADGWHERVALQPPTADTLALTEALAHAWEARPQHIRAGTPLKVGVTLAGLEPATGATGSLFERVQADTRVSKAMDAINARFGKSAVFLASMQKAKDSAPSRIAFQSVPELEPKGGVRAPKRQTPPGPKTST